ncbi:MAG: hypothetical protein U5R31_07465 [Acidimicrobiia bacterium]|nr:hypothetical protein [Acidimicrobiia bacterium]
MTAEGVAYQSHRPGGDLESPAVYRADGSRVDISVTDRLHPAIFGQAQLQGLVATENLRDFFVRQAPERWRPLATEEAEQVRHLDNASGAMSGIESQTETLEDKKAELHDLRDQLRGPPRAVRAADKIG